MDVAMKSGMRAVCAAVVLGFGFIGLTSVARAEDTYNFTYVSTDGSVSANGSFDLTSALTNTNVVANVILNGVSFTTGMDVGIASFVGNNLIIGAVSNFNVSTNSYANGFNVSGNVNQANNSFSGQVNSQAQYGGNTVVESSGFFEASLSSGGSSASGGAPSPEVNAFLGLALAGGTVAFLRRRRREPVASAA